MSNSNAASDIFRKAASTLINNSYNSGKYSNISSTNPNNLNTSTKSSKSK
jgi:hypothetical protein